MFDAHIHSHYGKSDTPQEFLRKAAEGGIDGGNILSVCPNQDIGCQDGDYRWQARLESVLAFTRETPGFLPYLYFDPTEPDGIRQVEIAAERGIAGYKIICKHFYPEDAIPACEAIAATGLPVMFHSGILGGSRDQISGKYNNPIKFECLFGIRGLRFSLAHLGWPWVDEYLGMVAKASFTFDPAFGNEMFFDLTPGTPGIYREEALRKLYLTGYGVKRRVLWGTDGVVNGYRPSLPEFWIRRDRDIMTRIAADAHLARAPFQQQDPDLHDIFKLATEDNLKAFNRSYRGAPGK